MSYLQIAINNVLFYLKKINYIYYRIFMYGINIMSHLQTAIDNILFNLENFNYFYG